MKKIKQRSNKNDFFVAHILELAEAIFFKFGMQTSLPSGNFYSIFDLIQIRNTLICDKACDVSAQTTPFHLHIAGIYSLLHSTI